MEHNITIIAEHSVCLDLLPERANILDAGCRGFEFSNEMIRLSHLCYSVDCDDLKTPRLYHRLAIAASDGTCAVKKNIDPQATSIKEGCEIEKLTIASFAKRCGVKKFDLIKLDIEGEEYAIMKQAMHPIAKMLSIELHAHCHPQQGKRSLDDLLYYLRNYYYIYGDVWESKHGAGFNYWDILLVSK